MSDRKPVYTEDGITFRAAVVGASHHAATVRGDAWGTVPARSAQDSTHQQTKAALWNAMLDEARVKVLLRRVAELEAENRRLSALLGERDDSPSATAPEFPIRALRGGDGVPR